jgi:hypothetical protein
MEEKKISLITRIRRRWNQRLKDRKGQSTTEYILILAIVVMLASKMRGTLTSLLQGKVDKIGEEINNF